MVKVRMNTADVAAEVKCLKRLIGMRCSNVYDLNPKTYVFKLTNSSGVTDSGESEKLLLLMESGVRLHTTAYVRDKENTPSGFTLKLRKHIRNHRLEDVYQLGYDRIVLFQFGLGPKAHYIILELYAQGNILLADSEFTVLTLLRSHRDDNKGFATMSRHRYPTEMCRTFEPTSINKLSESLDFKENEGDELVKASDGDEPVNEKPKMENDKGRVGKSAVSNKNSKQASLKMMLGDVLGYGPALSEHIILDAGLVPSKKMCKEDKLDDASINLLAQAVFNFETWLQDVISGEKIPEGYILMQNLGKANDHKVGDDTEASKQVYDEFCPILMNQFRNREYAKFDNFDAALDEFYSKYESQRAEKQQRSREDSAVQKLDRIRQDQENRVRSLITEVDRCVKMAELIEYNLEDVDNAILAVRVSLAKGMSWEDITSMVKEEKKSGNPIAGIIDKLHFERNCMTLLLSNNLDEMDDEEKTLPATKVEVDLSLSAHANARRWYEMKKKQESKQEKTVAAHAKAFKAAERKTRLQLAQEKVAATIYHIRKVHWFEKFNWFISSENYLIISGRDAQQNEMIVKRYMSKDDLFVHADLHGASSTVIKNHRPNQPVPPLTLNQAGCFTVCHSQAWNSKIVISAWWVYPHQVSKTAPTGEYLTVGSFMIRGKKNFLPPHPLVMGFGLLFRLDESSLGAHLNERKVKTEEGSLNDVADEDNVSVEPTSDSEDEKPELQDTNSLQTTAASDVESVTSQLDDLIDKTLSLGTTKMSSVQSNEGPSLTVKPEVIREKPHMSKYDRRKQKKDPKPENSALSTNSTAVDTNKQSGAKISRGQRSKLKKIKEKYADQDDEERTIRMALLGSAGNTRKETEDTDVQDKDFTVPQESVKVCYRCKKTGHLARDCTEVNESTVTNDDDDINEIGEEDKAKLNDIDYLTGIPQTSDVLLYAVPVCGPYNALQSYKYRVKIIPGSLKKGKAAKTAVNLFGHMTEASQREKELIKACTDPELVAALIGNVKISAAGLTQLKQKPKKGRPDKTGS